MATIDEAVASAERDGWTVLVEEDPTRTGPSATRNRLFERAKAQGFEVVRYLDDDDIVLPHRERCLEALAGIDLVYHDAIEVIDGHAVHTRCNPDPAKVHFCPPDAWGWVATVEALERVRVASSGILWPDIPIFEGYFMFLNMVKLGLEMRHVPIEAYEYRIGDGIHNSPEVSRLVEQYRAAAARIEPRSRRA